MYDGSGPDWRDLADREADFASRASRQGKDRAGFEEGRWDDCSSFSATADCALRGGYECIDLPVTWSADKLTGRPSFAAIVYAAPSCRTSPVALRLRGIDRAAPRRENIVADTVLVVRRGLRMRTRGARGACFLHGGDTSAPRDHVVQERSRARRR